MHPARPPTRPACRMAPQASPPETTTWRPVFAATLSLFLSLQCAVVAYSTPVGVPPDEYAHLSCVDDVARGRLIPDYVNGRIRGSNRGNYLAHPPLYYTITGKVAQFAGFDPFQGARRVRALGALFVAGGFFLWLLAAREARVPLAGILLSTVAACAVPMFSYAAGSVNNDTLLYFGVGLFAYGLAREWIAERRDRWAAAAIVGGSVTVFLTKSTGAAFLVFLVAALVPRNREGLASLVTPRHLKMAAVVAATCGAWFVFALIAYGSVMPRPEALYPHAPPAEPMVPMAYVVRYSQAMWDRLPILMAHVNVRPFAPYGALAMKTMLALPLVAWLLARPGARRRGSDPRVIHATDALALASFATLALHIAYTYLSYRNSGLLAGMQPRYFAFLLPALWLPAFLLRGTGKVHAILLAASFASAVVAFWTSVPFTVQKQDAAVSAARARQSTPPAAPVKKLVGSVDGFMHSADGRLALRGWAFDARQAAQVARISVFVDGKRLANLRTGEQRPDVAKALGHPTAARGGFSATLEGAGDRDCALAVAAETGDGRVLWLRRATCGTQPRLP